MARFNDLLRQHTEQVERRSVTVDIAGQSVTLYAKPLTGRDMDRVMARHKNFAASPTVEAVIDLLIMKVETDDGEKAFDPTSKPFLVKMPVEWINRVRAALFPDHDADLSEEAIEEEAGN
jgi:hypothetical protein